MLKLNVKMNPLYISDKIEVRNSEIHGRGVFAKEFIPSGTLIEECHYIPLEKKWNEMETILQEYVFAWPKVNWKRSVIVLGFGSIYNHSRNNNADWDTDLDRDVFKFFTIKDINKGEEIFTNYGPEYEKHVITQKLKI
jgi:SET domain-containing protein